jgi:endonuclease/exonuclease/phosphatase family metal-dependent hydrolase
MKTFILFLIILPMTAMSSELKLLTWNVYMIPKPIQCTKQGTRTKLIAKELSKIDHDLILMQEAFSLPFRRKISKALSKSHPYQDTLGRGGRGVKFLNSGLFILSRYPYKILGTAHFNLCTTYDCLAAKGVILVEIKHPSGKSIQVATSHLQSEGSVQAREARAYQFQVIKQLFNTHREEGVAQILAGDLNVNGRRTGEGSEYLEALRVLEMTSGELEGQLQYSANFRIPCYKVSSTNGMSWLDHVLIAENGSTTSVTSRKILPINGIMKGIECPLSDHHGVEAVIKI